tara:strand:- start:196 stop:393 length:198 start_codon:yes stop_codon:yes gene_type:complete
LLLSLSIKDKGGEVVNGKIEEDYKVSDIIFKGHVPEGWVKADGLVCSEEFLAQIQSHPMFNEEEK